MRSLLTVLIISVLFIGCTKNYQNKIEGRYQGTFHRYIDPVSNPATSTVQLHFSEEDFTGVSSTPKYPAIGSGKYSATANKLNIENQSFYTADFDWSLIFDGEFNYKFEGNKLEIWKGYAGGMKDVYLLERVQ